MKTKWELCNLKDRVGHGRVIAMNKKQHISLIRRFLEQSRFQITHETLPVREGIWILDRKVAPRVRCVGFGALYLSRFVDRGHGDINRCKAQPQLTISGKKFRVIGRRRTSCSNEDFMGCYALDRVHRNHGVHPHSVGCTRAGRNQSENRNNRESEHGLSFAPRRLSRV